MPQPPTLASRLPIYPKALAVKDHIQLFIVYTLLQIAFASAYYLLVQRINTTLCIGTVLYATAMLATYLSFRNERYRRHRQELLDALP